MTETEAYRLSCIDETEALLGKPFLSEPLGENPDKLYDEDFEARLFAYRVCCQILARARARDRLYDRPLRPDVETSSWNDAWASTKRIAKLALEYKQEITGLWRQIELAEQVQSYYDKHKDTLLGSLTDKEMLCVENVMLSLKKPLYNTTEDYTKNISPARRGAICSDVSLNTSSLPCVMNNIITASSEYGAKRILHVTTSEYMQDQLMQRLTEASPNLNISVLSRHSRQGSLAQAVIVTRALFKERFRDSYIDGYPIDFIISYKHAEADFRLENDSLLTNWHGFNLELVDSAVPQAVPAKPPAVTSRPVRPKPKPRPKQEQPRPTQNRPQQEPSQITTPTEDRVLEAVMPADPQEQRSNTTELHELDDLLQGTSIQKEAAILELCKAGFVLQVYFKADQARLGYLVPSSAKSHLEHYILRVTTVTQEEAAAHFGVPVAVITYIVNDPLYGIDAINKQAAILRYDRQTTLTKLDKLLRLSKFKRAIAKLYPEGQDVNTATQQERSFTLDEIELAPHILDADSGDKTLNTIALEVGITYATARLRLTEQEWQSGKERRVTDSSGKTCIALVWSSDDSGRIKERLQQFKPRKLPAYLIPYQNLRYFVVLGKKTRPIVQQILQASPHFRQDVSLKDHAGITSCITWTAIEVLARVVGRPSETTDLDFTRLPTGPDDLSPEKIAYAQAIQRQFVELKYIEAYEQGDSET